MPDDLQFKHNFKNHTFIHKTVVVGEKVVYFILLFPFSIYSVEMGFLLSETTFAEIIPSFTLNILGPLNHYLPKYLNLQYIFYGELGSIFHSASSWWTQVIGIPLIIEGTILLFIISYEFILALFNPIWNLTHCHFCKKPVELSIGDLKIF